MFDNQKGNSVLIQLNFKLLNLGMTGSPGFEELVQGKSRQVGCKGADGSPDKEGALVKIFRLRPQKYGKRRRSEMLAPVQTFYPHLKKCHNDHQEADMEKRADAADPADASVLFCLLAVLNFWLYTRKLS